MNVYKITYSISDDYGVGLYPTHAETVVEALDELRRCVGPVDRICKIEKGREPVIQELQMNERFSKLICQTSTILVYYMDSTGCWVVEDGDQVESFSYCLDAMSYAEGVLMERHSDFEEV